MCTFPRLVPRRVRDSRRCARQTWTESPLTHGPAGRDHICPVHPLMALRTTPKLLAVSKSLTMNILECDFWWTPGRVSRTAGSPGRRASNALRNCHSRGAWVAQSFKRPTLAQVTISRFAGSSPASGSVLTARSLEPASDSVSPSLSVPLLPMLCLSLSQK